MRFQSTQSSQTVTQQLGGISIGWIISIHTVLADCDSTSTLYALPSNKFQSTQSSQTVTLLHVDIRTKEWDFNPHSPRRLWRRRWLRWHRHSNISIHTVLADCDLSFSDTNSLFLISIHTVLADCDINDLVTGGRVEEFQSTQSSQTVTVNSGKRFLLFFYFNPHSPRRLWLGKSEWWHSRLLFQSTQSSQTVTQCRFPKLLHLINFNPHSPRRLWQTDLHQDQNIRRFQSTQSSQTVTRISQCV